MINTQGTIQKVADPVTVADPTGLNDTCTVWGPAIGRCFQSGVG